MDPSLPDALNSFYACFEASNTSSPSALFTLSTDDPSFSITTAEVRNTLQKVNHRKAAGSDGIPGRVFKDCAQQLSEVLKDIFNT